LKLARWLKHDQKIILIWSQEVLWILSLVLEPILGNHENNNCWRACTKQGKIRKNTDIVKTNCKKILCKFYDNLRQRHYCDHYCKIVYIFVKIILSILFKNDLKKFVRSVDSGNAAWESDQTTITIKMFLNFKIAKKLPSLKLWICGRICVSWH